MGATNALFFIFWSHQVGFKNGDYNFFVRWTVGCACLIIVLFHHLIITDDFQMFPCLVSTPTPPLREIIDDILLKT